MKNLVIIPQSLKWSFVRNFRVIGHSPAFWLLSGVALAAIGANLIANEGKSQPSDTKISAENAGVSKKIVREGARVESKAVRARISGDKLLLDVEGENLSFEGLENLSLQRIAHSLQEDSSDSRWIVTGQITEFKEQNFLLLERVMRAPVQLK